MNALLAILILAWLLLGVWLMYEDITSLSEQESMLDELWDDGE